MHNLNFLFLLLLMSFCVAPLKCYNETAAKAHVGVILDSQTTLGKIFNSCISMAIEDFYSKRDHTTMIVPRFRNSNSDVVTAASAAIDLLKNDEVMAILGPQKSIQADFVIDIGVKANVPIISPATSPSLSPEESPYFIRSAWSSTYQVKAIADIVKKYGWREVVFVHEDTKYGRGLVPFLTEDLLKSNALISHQILVSSVATDDQIRLELCKLMNMQTRVFIVHMLPSLASRFFPLAKEAGMMGEGYVWIIADVLTNLFHTMDSKTVEAMQGVVGVKAYIPESSEFENFKKRWSRRFHEENPDMDRTELNILGLWAYDSTTALAEAIEQVGVTYPVFDRSVGREATDLDGIGRLNLGPSLVRLLTNHTSKGLSGDFNITNGNLQPSAFEIVNVNDRKEIRVGFWTEQCGIVRPDEYQVGCLSEKENLDPIVWPGKTNKVPKGWEIPTNGKKLRVGVPAKPGFNEFIKVETNNETYQVKVNGFTIDVFEAVMKSMPYAVTFEYQPCGEDYDDIVEKISNKTLDAVVGDFTVTASRSEFADFTIPYSESGIVIVVPVKHDERKNAWIFLKPLTTGLWLTVGAFFIFTGFVVWVFEHRVNEEFRGPPTQQVGVMFWYSFSTMVYAHRERVRSNFTRFVVIVWVFVVLVLSSSYTANLTSMLTVEQLQPKTNDIRDLIKNGENVGYQGGSFVSQFLTNMSSLRFESSKLKNYSNLEQFDEALSRGSRNGGVGAIADELPYIRLFLSKYCDKYTMIGPIYPTSGLSFAFPKGSALVPDVSREILKLKESEEMVKITNKWLDEAKACTNTDGALINSRSLNLDSFKGLFLIAALTSSIALAIFLGTFLYQHRYILTSSSSIKEKLYGLARVFAYEKDESLSSKESGGHDHGGGVSGESEAVSIQCDEGEVFTSIEISPGQPSSPSQEANS